MAGSLKLVPAGKPLADTEGEVAQAAGDRRDNALRIVVSGRGVIVAKGQHRTYGTRDGALVEVGAAKLFWDTRSPDGVWLECRGPLLRQLDDMPIGSMIRFAGQLSIRRKGVATYISVRVFELEGGLDRAPLAQPEAERDAGRQPERSA